MYTTPRSHSLQRSLLLNHHGSTISPLRQNNTPQKIKKQLKALGVSVFGLARLESRYLPNVIHPDERLGGVVYGRHRNGSVMLVATDRRVIFLDKKPFFVNKDEINYDVVSGVSYTHAGPVTTVNLHTRVRDYAIRTLNQKCAQQFVHYIEYRCLEHQKKEARDDNPAKNWAL